MDQESFFGAANLQECKQQIEESMQIMDQIGTDAKQKVSELGNLNDSTLELRNFIVVLGIAFAPLILVVLFGFVFLAACSTVAYGVPMLFVWLSISSVLYAAIVSCCTWMDRRREPSEVDPQGQQQQGLFAQLQRYAAKLKTEASAYHSPAKRAAYCQKPWLASVALLGVEASVAASSGYSLAFLQAFCCTLLAALGSGTMLGYLHGSLGPPSATQLEVAAAALARSPWVAQAVAAVAVLGAPLVEERAPSAMQLHALGAQTLDKASFHVQKVEAARTKLQKCTGRVLDTAVSLEKVIGGSSEEREKAMKNLTDKAASNAKGFASVATRLLGMEGEEREQIKAAAAGYGDVWGGMVGLALNGAGVSKSHEPVVQAEQALRGGFQLLKSLAE